MQLGCMVHLFLAAALLTGEAAKLGSLSGSAGDVISKLSSLVAGRPEVADLSTLTLQTVLLATSDSSRSQVFQTGESLQKMEALVDSWARQRVARKARNVSVETVIRDCFDKNIGVLVAADNDPKDCYGNLSEAVIHCAIAGKCYAVWHWSADFDTCDGYRITHGTPDYRVRADWQPLNIHTYILRDGDNCTDAMSVLGQAESAQEAAESMSDSASIIQDALNVMKASIKERLEFRQGQLDRASAAVESCRPKLWVAYKESQRLQDLLPHLNTSHRACRSVEGRWKFALDDCQLRLGGYESQYEVYKPICDHFKSQYPDGSFELCNNRNGSAGEHYLNLWEFWENYIDWYDGNMSRCEEWHTKVSTWRKNCSEIHSGWSPKRHECNDYQARMDITSCEFLRTAEDGCQAYSTCFDGAFSNLVFVNSSLAEEEAQLRQEWRVVLRIECLLPIFASAQKDDSIIEYCAGKTHDLSEISANFSNGSVKVNETAPFSKICEANLSAYAVGTLEHTEFFYSDLPWPLLAPVNTSHSNCPSKSGGTKDVHSDMHFLCAHNTTFIPSRNQSFPSSADTLNFTAALHGPNAWSPIKDEAGQSFEVDLGKVETIGGAFIQGGLTNGTCFEQWVTSFWLSYSTDGLNWDYVKTPILGNHDCETDVAHWFTPMLQARHVRYVVEEWHGKIAMRMGLLLCHQP